jgi:ribosomal protein L3 glutamine methyltransferase
MGDRDGRSLEPLRLKTMSESLATVRDYIRWGVSRFNEAGLHFGHGTDNAFDEATFLVLQVLHLPYDLPDAYLDTHLTLAEQDKLQEVLEKRIVERIPAAYLTGRTRFAGLDFQVNEKVLIPRSPIAELVEQGYAPWVDHERVHNILDLCAGSGCIGIASAYAFPQARVDLGELSEEAAAVARSNVESHQLQDRVDVVVSDLFEGLADRTYDIIVSNPPYVGRGELKSLPPEFSWEPRMGLAAGEDGLDLVRRILCEAGHYLKPDGILVVEVGNSEEALVEEFPEVPFVWLEFERGGHGVFLLTKPQLEHYHCKLEK